MKLQIWFFLIVISPNFNESSLSIIFSMDYALVSKSYIQNVIAPKSSMFSPISSSSFIVWWLLICSVTHIELIFTKKNSLCLVSKFSFCMWMFICSSTTCWRDTPLYYLGSFVTKTGWVNLYGSVSGQSILLSGSLCSFTNTKLSCVS